MNKLPSTIEMTPALITPTVDHSRAITEVQAAMVVAQNFPRDENQAFQKIMTACQRKSLAERAVYAYRRGSSIVTGPSIRLAEVMARCYKNMDYGFREISRGNGSSEVEAYCWDMENNVRVKRTFTVKHWRDTKGGGYAITDERDKYELLANMAQRRVRACILEMIPGDIVEEAVNQCNKTLEGGEGPIEDRVRKMVISFKDQGVTQDMIEAYLGHKLDAILPAQLVQLQNIFKSIRDGVTNREDFFVIEKEGKHEKSLKNAVSKAEKKNPLHATPEWAKYKEACEIDPEISGGFPEPTTTDECLKAVNAINNAINEQNA